MAAKENPDFIEGTRRLLVVDVLDYEKTAEDSSIVHDDDAFD